MCLSRSTPNAPLASASVRSDLSCQPVALVVTGRGSTLLTRAGHQRGLKVDLSTVSCQEQAKILYGRESMGIKATPRHVFQDMRTF